ncbi:MAG: hypothetical protein D5S03_08700 [Desulfonatronospira sp. MSAO_Bac3]|nr:MAG: hypothetical protein D5S03_08700 [Desulfonatronospira sp. MSAO_Bac3]
MNKPCAWPGSRYFPAFSISGQHYMALFFVAANQISMRRVRLPATAQKTWGAFLVINCKATFFIMEEE